MSDDDRETINFEDRRRFAETDERVCCPRCNKFIFMHEVRCEHCGLHFAGDAWQFSPSTSSQARSSRWQSRWLTAAIVAAILVALVLAYL